MAAADKVPPPSSQGDLDETDIDSPSQGRAGSGPCRVCADRGRGGSGVDHHRESVVERCREPLLEHHAGPRQHWYKRPIRSLPHGTVKVDALVTEPRASASGGW